MGCIQRHMDLELMSWKTEEEVVVVHMMLVVMAMADRKMQVPWDQWVLVHKKMLLMLDQWVMVERYSVGLLSHNQGKTVCLQTTGCHNSDNACFRS
jgi:hypothetical protein